MILLASFVVEARKRGRRAKAPQSVPPNAIEHVACEGLVVASRYRLEEQIGSGGMSSIWVASDLVSHGQVAVKMMVKPEQTRSDLVARFHREAEVAKKFRGPPFVAVLDHGDHEGTPYIVMQLLDGENLQQRLTRKHTLAISDTQILLDDLSSGLRVAHKLGIIHRDLKPANLFFARLPERLRSRRDEVVKILDFGIARSDAFGERLTKAGHIVGSLFYMSPEQARAESNVDARSDLWQVGAILYRCLTGRRPFEGSPGAVLHRLAREDVALASTVNPDLPRSFDPFFAKALARTPEARFQTIDELLAGFRDAAKVVSGTRPAVRPPSLPEAEIVRDTRRDSDSERLTIPVTFDDTFAGVFEPRGKSSRPPPPRVSDAPPTVIYNSARPVPRLTPNTVPAYFSIKDRPPSIAPSPWASKKRSRRARNAWLLAFLFIFVVMIAVAAAATAVGFTQLMR